MKGKAENKKLADEENAKKEAENEEEEKRSLEK